MGKKNRKKKHHKPKPKKPAAEKVETDEAEKIEEPGVTTSPPGAEATEEPSLPNVVVDDQIVASEPSAVEQVTPDLVQSNKEESVQVIPEEEESKSVEQVVLDSLTKKEEENDIEEDGPPKGSADTKKPLLVEEDEESQVEPKAPQVVEQEALADTESATIDGPFLVVKEERESTKDVDHEDLVVGEDTTTLKNLEMVHETAASNQAPEDSTADNTPMDTDTTPLEPEPEIADAAVVIHKDKNPGADATRKEGDSEGSVPIEAGVAPGEIIDTPTADVTEDPDKDKDKPEASDALLETVEPEKTISLLTTPAEDQEGLAVDNSTQETVPIEAGVTTGEMGDTLIADATEKPDKDKPVASDVLEKVEPEKTASVRTTPSSEAPEDFAVDNSAQETVPIEAGVTTGEMGDTLIADATEKPVKDKPVANDVLEKVEPEKTASVRTTPSSEAPEDFAVDNSAQEPLIETGVAPGEIGDTLMPDVTEGPDKDKPVANDVLEKVEPEKTASVRTTPSSEAPEDFAVDNSAQEPLIETGVAPGEIGDTLMPDVTEGPDKDKPVANDVLETEEPEKTASVLPTPTEEPECLAVENSVEAGDKTKPVASDVLEKIEPEKTASVRTTPSSEAPEGLAVDNSSQEVASEDAVKSIIQPSDEPQPEATAKSLVPVKTEYRYSETVEDSASIEKVDREPIIFETPVEATTENTGDVPVAKSAERVANKHLATIDTSGSKESKDANEDAIAVVGGFETKPAVLDTPNVLTDGESSMTHATIDVKESSGDAAKTVYDAKEDTKGESTEGTPVVACADRVKAEPSVPDVVNKAESAQIPASPMPSSPLKKSLPFNSPTSPTIAASAISSPKNTPVSPSKKLKIPDAFAGNSPQVRPGTKVSPLTPSSKLKTSSSEAAKSPPASLGGGCSSSIVYTPSRGKKLSIPAAFSSPRTSSPSKLSPALTPSKSPSKKLSIPNIFAEKDGPVASIEGEEDPVEVTKKRAAVAARIKAEREAVQQAAEAEERRKAAQAEAMRAAEARKSAAAEEARRKAQEEKRMKEKLHNEISEVEAQMEIVRKKAAEQKAREKEQATRAATEAEIARVEAEVQALKKKQEEVKARAEKKNAEHARAQKEAARLKAEKEATERVRAEKEAARIKAEQEDAGRMRAEAEAAKFKAEQEAERIRAEAAKANTEQDEKRVQSDTERQGGRNKTEKLVEADQPKKEEVRLAIATKKDDSVTENKDANAKLEGIVDAAMQESSAKSPTLSVAHSDENISPASASRGAPAPYVENKAQSNAYGSCGACVLM